MKDKLSLNCSGTDRQGGGGVGGNARRRGGGGGLPKGSRYLFVMDRRAVERG